MLKDTLRYGSWQGAARLFVPLFLAVALVLPAFALGPGVMVKDINPGAANSQPSSMAALGNKGVFAANIPAYGTEPWVSDGTAAGTLMLKDILLGSIPSSPMYMTTVGAYVYFVANDHGHGIDLWRTNVTPAGTVLVQDIYP